MRNKNYQAGMTLIEIMIALLIGAFLIGGVLEIFINSRQTYRMQEDLSRLQENGRFALSFLADDIRMAGFVGCNNGTAPTNMLASTAFLYDFNTAISGFESTSTSAWTPALDTSLSSLSPSPLGGSDVITIRRAADQSFTVTAQASASAGLTLDTSATTANLKTAGFLTSAGANNCTTAIVSNCSSSAIFQVNAIAGGVLSLSAGSGCTPDNSPTTPTYSFPATYVGGQVYPINTISYYVGTNGNNSLSLYRKVGTASTQELVEGIEQMQILYGVYNSPTSPFMFHYVSADQVTTANWWPYVVSVRISLLGVTLDDNLTAQPVPYKYPLPDSTATTPTDRKIRRVFNATIAIRN